MLTLMGTSLVSFISNFISAIATVLGLLGAKLSSKKTKEDCYIWSRLGKA